MRTGNNQGSQLETLEARRLLSVAWKTVVINGTPGPDNITIKVKPYHIYRVDTGAGNDSVRFIGKTTAVKTCLKLGEGDDCAVLTAGNDNVEAGKGNDKVVDLFKSGKNAIKLQCGDDIYEATCSWNWVDGGEGRDRITTGNRNDTLIGGGGEDYINAGSGDDWVDGGDRHGPTQNDGNVDTLIGGKGNDLVLVGDTWDGIFDKISGFERVFRTKDLPAGYIPH